MKVCTKCKLPKEVTEFGKLSSSKDGLNPQCLDCKRLERIKWRKANPEKVFISKKKWARNHPNVVYKATKKWADKNPDKVKKRYKKWKLVNKYQILEKMLLKTFNLTLDQYEQMLFEQDYCCAICGINESDLLEMTGVSLCIDHDHSCCPNRNSCGKCVRGMLCSDCNSGIGRFKDQVNSFRSAINYLTNYKDTHAVNSFTK